ncbi:STAS domain-containing protein [Sphaerisporangium corydalis]|uniref:Anti-sigma factor antagonist n=1 Tax=Sphaerisporangium corydalis TaxID=1441875 RepID=A0ABV9EP01_9ACTN|nr:STAS domain-containing protein [Sphaerisporangium corydalis]
MDLSTRVNSDWTVCSVAGDVNIFTTHEFREHLLAALDRPGRRLLVDLSAVTFMDASGLAVLIFIRRMAMRRGGTLRLLAPTRLLRRLLTTSGLSRTFTVSLDLPAVRKAEAALTTV